MDRRRGLRTTVAAIVAGCLVALGGLPTLTGCGAAGGSATLPPPPPPTIATEDSSVPATLTTVAALIGTTSTVATTTSTVATTTSAPPGLPTNLPDTAPTIRVPILMYHFVDDTPPPAGRYSAGLTVSTPDFEEQMKYLAENGFRPVTLEDIYAAMAGLRALPPKPVAITFDDGNKDNFTVAFPILRRHGFVATFFVITGYVGGRLSVSWEDLRIMQEAGMAIESHTVDHPDLRTVSAAKLQMELTGSRDEIAARLGKAPIVLCYPVGKHNDKVIAATRAAGYLMAVTTTPGKTLSASSRYKWPRVRVNPGESLKGFISSLM